MALIGNIDDAGDFDIRDDLSIVGVSPTQSIVFGNSFNSAFHVHDDAAISASACDVPSSALTARAPKPRS